MEWRGSEWVVGGEKGGDKEAWRGRKRKEGSWEVKQG